MRNTWKVARWEIKRNMKNKTFLIGMLSTPVIFIGFMLLGSLFGGSDSENIDPTQVFVNDEVGVIADIERIVEESALDWDIYSTDLSREEMEAELDDRENTAFLLLDHLAVQEGTVSVYLSEGVGPFFQSELRVISPVIQALQLEELGLSEDEMAVVARGITFVDVTPRGSDIGEGAAGDGEGAGAGESDFMERLVPGAFAGFIMVSIVFTGMAIFQSASQEKKDKLAEIILSSLTPSELMQGKIIGYFALGIIQSLVSIVFIVPFLIWRYDFPILEYLFVPELAVLLLIAVLGFLLFAAIFVGIGATMEDITTAGNFQGIVMMLPFSPAIFIGPVLSDPNGLMAQIGTYIPFTSPGVMILRLTMLEEWPWIEVIIGTAILAVSVWLFMKLAGKIFHVGILMYGKNATPGEIWKWLRGS
ncbi:MULTISPECIES: ABC transporter permease [Bacillaceae]|uniref:ABC transporter permease n=1 Tax=Evansella alkalicola TaxID=745819 RepID=A0ABS6JXH4_9BACI|nr:MULTISPECIES: ABC transporter permease [Bacillaceae]MBU9723296.1 ABC transporter permease [Bacillus alkalicola]